LFVLHCTALQNRNVKQLSTASDSVISRDSRSPLIVILIIDLIKLSNLLYQNRRMQVDYRLMISYVRPCPWAWRSINAKAKRMFSGALCGIISLVSWKWRPFQELWLLVGFLL